MPQSRGSAEAREVGAEEERTPKATRLAKAEPEAGAREEGEDGEAKKPHRRWGKSAVAEAKPKPAKTEKLAAAPRKEAVPTKAAAKPQKLAVVAPKKALPKPAAKAKPTRRSPPWRSRRSPESAKKAPAPVKEVSRRQQHREFVPELREAQGRRPAEPVEAAVEPKPSLPTPSPPSGRAVTHARTRPTPRRASSARTPVSRPSNALSPTSTTRRSAMPTARCAARSPAPAPASPTTSAAAAAPPASPAPTTTAWPRSATSCAKLTARGAFEAPNLLH